MAADGWPLRDLYRALKTPGTNRLRDAHAALDSAVRAACGMKVSEDTLAILLALNLELADREAKGVQVTPPGLPVPAGEAAEFMSKDCVTVREGVEGQMSTPQPKPPSRSRRLWTAEEDSLLGTKSDRALARKFGRTVKAVKARRQSKGVFLVKEWRPEDDKILGTRPDQQVGMLLGRSKENVAWRRRKLGIPCFCEFRRWTPEQLELLGRKPDEEVATLTGHPLSAVTTKRVELGRPKADPILTCWTPEQDRLLGTMPDDEVARRVGRTRMAVQKRRFRLGIGYKRPERQHWTQEELALLGALPDAELAQRLQRSVRRVAYKRKSLHIPHCPAGRAVRKEAGFD